MAGERKPVGEGSTLRLLYEKGRLEPLLGVLVIDMDVSGVLVLARYEERSRLLPEVVSCCCRESWRRLSWCAASLAARAALCSAFCWVGRRRGRGRGRREEGNGGT